MGTATFASTTGVTPDSGGTCAGMDEAAAKKRREKMPNFIGAEAITSLAIATSQEAPRVRNRTQAQLSSAATTVNARMRDWFRYCQAIAAHIRMPITARIGPPGTRKRAAPGCFRLNAINAAHATA